MQNVDEKFALKVSLSPVTSVDFRLIVFNNSSFLGSRFVMSPSTMPSFFTSLS